jgi:hypothetical protein
MIGPCLCGDPACRSCGPLLADLPVDVDDADDAPYLTAEELAEIRGDDEYHRRVDEGEPLLPSERMAAGLRL